LKFFLNSAWCAVSVQSLEAVHLLHLFKLLLNPLLILNKTVVHVPGSIHIHARLPIIEHRVLSEIPLNKYFRADRDVEHSIGYERNTVDLLDPVRLHAPNNCSSHERIYVAVRQYNEPRSQCWQNPVFKLISEVSCVEQAQRSGSQNIALHCCFEFAA